MSRGRAARDEQRECCSPAPERRGAAAVGPTQAATAGRPPSQRRLPWRAVSGQRSGEGSGLAASAAGGCAKAPASAVPPSPAVRRQPDSTASRPGSILACNASRHVEGMVRVRVLSAGGAFEIRPGALQVHLTWVLRRGAGGALELASGKRLDDRMTSAPPGNLTRGAVWIRRGDVDRSPFPPEHITMAPPRPVLCFSPSRTQGPRECWLSGVASFPEKS